MTHACAGLTVLLVDDHPLFRDGMQLALMQAAPGLDVIALGDADAALARIAQAPDAFDLVIVDHRLPGGRSGLAWAGELRARYPGVPCALISGDDRAELPRAAARAGLAAFLPKTLDAATLLDAIAAVAAGSTWFPAAVTPGTPDLPLTGRQREILDVAARGASSKEIARELGISVATVRTHVAQILERLGARNRAHAVAILRAAAEGQAGPAAVVPAPGECES
ncbi:MAG: response regulator transcription factor [Gammaproteobacteria bacterium]